MAEHPFYLAAECHEEVSRKGELQPCDNQSVALKADVEGDYPVCAFHARGPMVPLLQVAARVRADTLREAAEFLRRDMDAPHGDRAANRLDVLAQGGSP